MTTTPKRLRSRKVYHAGTPNRLQIAVLREARAATDLVRTTANAQAER